jgi:hypothetical protein
MGRFWVSSFTIVVVVILHGKFISLGPNPMYSRFFARVVLALRSFGILGKMVGVMCNICNCRIAGPV